MSNEKTFKMIGGVARSLLLKHYGAKKYLPERVLPVENKDFVKPKRGGLWTSPVDSKWGWKHWNEISEFRDCTEDDSFVVKLHRDTNILIIDSLDDLKNAPLMKGFMGKVLDFEEITKEYDCIWLTQKGEQETRLSYPFNLYGWDCETVFIMNPHCCKEEKNNEIKVI